MDFHNKPGYFDLGKPPFQEIRLSLVKKNIIIHLWISILQNPVDFPMSCMYIYIYMYRGFLSHRGTPVIIHILDWPFSPWKHISHLNNVRFRRRCPVAGEFHSDHLLQILLFRRQLPEGHRRLGSWRWPRLFHVTSGGKVRDVYGFLLRKP